MDDSKFTHLFAKASAYLALGVSSFVLLAMVTVAGVNFNTFVMQAGGMQAAAAVGAVAVSTVNTTDDYGTGAVAGTYCPKLSSTFQRGARDATTDNQVSELQSFLADYYKLDDGALVGGYFGTLTEKYLIKFQKEQNLPAFGIAGQLTRAAITKACGSAASVGALNTKTPSAAVAMGTHSFVDMDQLRASGASKVCSYIEGQSQTGKVYIANNKIAVVEYSAGYEQARRSYLLIDATSMYLWSGATSTVIKSSVPADLYTNTTKYFICVDGTPDPAVFALPANAQIIDAAAQTQVSAAASKRSQVERARLAFDSTAFTQLVSVVQKIRLSSRTDIPHLKAFAEKWGDSIISMDAQLQSLNQKPIANLTSTELDQLLASYTQLRSFRDLVLIAYNIIPASEWALILETSSSSTTNSSAKTISIVSPVGGEQYLVGSTVTFKWKGSGLPVDAYVNLVAIGVTSNSAFSIGNKISAALGSYTWSVNTATIPPGEYKLLLQVLTSSDSFVVQSKETPPFRIGAASEQASIKIISPNGGESYGAGSGAPLTVTWIASAMPANAKVCVTLQSTVNQFFAFPAGGGSCVAASNGAGQVTGPLVLTSGYNLGAGSYRAKVTAQGASISSGKEGPMLAEDLSDQVFNLTQSTITTSPPATDINAKYKGVSFDTFLKGTTFDHLARGSDGDILDGGEGIDTIFYSKTRSHYVLVRGHDVPESSLLNAVLVYDNDDGSIDVVLNAEYMTFADQTITLPDFTKVQ